MTLFIKVVTADLNTSIQDILDLMTSKQVGAVVILSTNEDGHPSLDRTEMKSKHQIPHGIVTKTDILHAYRRQVDIQEGSETILKNKPLVTCKPGDDRDRVASILERNKMHHVIVVQEEHFIGIVSSLDIAKECARDNRAWPYLRSEDGRVHLPRLEVEDDVLPPAYNPHLPTSIVNHKHDEVTTYMDDLDLEAFQ